MMSGDLRKVTAPMTTSQTTLCVLFLGIEQRLYLSKFAYADQIYPIREDITCIVFTGKVVIKH